LQLFIVVCLFRRLVSKFVDY
ncbi:hypothetical protein ACMD2_02105, partial [Ananas comosus]